MTSTTETTIAFEKHEMSLMMLMLEERLKKVHNEAMELPYRSKEHQSRIKAIQQMNTLKAKLEESYCEAFLGRK